MKPILIIKGDSSACYGILEKFSERLADAFKALGEEVIYINPYKDDILEYASREYKAVIAAEDLIFNNPDPSSLHQKLEKPVLNLF